MSRKSIACEDTDSFSEVLGVYIIRVLLAAFLVYLIGFFSLWVNGGTRDHFRIFVIPTGYVCTIAASYVVVVLLCWRKFWSALLHRRSETA